MAGTTYLPIEMQDDESNILYPHTAASLTWTSSGENVEQALNKKTEVVISNGSIPVDQRKAGTMYLIIEGTGQQSQAAVAKASPAVGYKVL